MNHAGGTMCFFFQGLLIVVCFSARKCSTRNAALRERKTNLAVDFTRGVFVSVSIGVVPVR